MKPSITSVSTPARYASCIAAIRPYSSRAIVLPLDGPPTTYVLPALRDTTFVCVFVFPNRVMRVCGISSVNLRSSSALGLS